MRFFGTILTLVFGATCLGTFATSRRLEREAQHLSPSLSAPAALALGAPARYLGRLEASAEELRSRDRGTPCVAYRTRVLLVTEDDDDREHRYLIFDERRGPPRLLVRGELGHVSIALERWTHLEKASRRRSRQRPAYQGATFSRPRTEGSPTGYEIEEQALLAGQRLFVAGIAGRLWDAAQPETPTPTASATAPVRELLPDPVLGRVEIFPGSQVERVEALRRRAFWHRVGGIASGALALLGVGLFVAGWLRR